MDGRDLKVYNERAMEVQFLRAENHHLRGDRNALRVQLYEVDQRFGRIEALNRRLVAENRKLARRVEELTAELRQRPGGDDHEGDAADAARRQQQPPPPAFVKANVPARRRKRPGRKRGHPAALRAMPQTIDVHQDVPLPTDDAGRCACPHCNCSLSDLRAHERVVEDVVPARVRVTAYHTTSGWCAQCRRVVESRAPEQPPAANVPHGQLGVNALATAATLRIVHRLPLRHVSRVLADLPGLTVSPGGIARQLQRVGRWLAPCCQRILLELRASPRVHADETGWRTDGRNGYVWTVTDPQRTLYHVDPSRGGTVIRRLLGETFGGKLVADFYAAYDQLDCAKQRCLVHLLRELKETAGKHPAFAGGAFHRQAKRLVKDMLSLKRRWAELSDQRYTTRALRLETRLEQLADMPCADPQSARLAKRLRRYRKELTEFLWDQHLDGTNNAAERALRPAVVARKISGGSRSDNGATAWARLATLMRTADQQGKNVLDVIRTLLIETWAGQIPTALLPGAP